MRLFVYDMLVNVNVIYDVHVCEQARWARSARNSAIENLCIIIIIKDCSQRRCELCCCQDGFSLQRMSFCIAVCDSAGC